MNTKSLFASKTFWFNVLAALTLLATQFGYTEFKLDADTADTIVKVIALAAPVVNVLLRRFTDRPATFTGN